MLIKVMKMAKWTMNDAFDGLNELTERKRRVLWAIVQDYSSTAEPVGSRTIARKYDLGEQCHYSQ